MTTPAQNQLERETKFTGKIFSVDVVRWKDDAGRLIERAMIQHRGAVLIVPMLDAENVVMIRNRRLAVNETLWEFPAGTAEQNEEPQKTAEREVIEETGYRAGKIELIGEFYTSPGFTNELMRVYLAADLTEVGQNLEPHEEIEVQVMPLARVREMAASGELRDGKSIAALFLVQERLKNGG